MLLKETQGARVIILALWLLKPEGLTYVGNFILHRRISFSFFLIHFQAVYSFLLVFKCRRILLFYYNPQLIAICFKNWDTPFKALSISIFSYHIEYYILEHIES